MTWEEAVVKARSNQDYKDLIREAYLSEDLKTNVLSYGDSLEFTEIKSLIDGFFGDVSLRVLDVGSGNGISAINFAMLGHQVVAMEPDLSNTVGAGAIQFLKELFSLDNLDIKTCFAEDYETNELFDMVFARQSMHHALDLNGFVENTSRFLKTGGYYFTVRDHVVNGEQDKANFLKAHPLHKYYGGENAFSKEEYRHAFINADLRIIKEISYFDSPINYAPVNLDNLKSKVAEDIQTIRKKLKQKLGWFGTLKITEWAYHRLVHNPNHLLDEKYIPGHMYSFIGQKI